MQVPKAEIQI